MKLPGTSLSRDIANLPVPIDRLAIIHLGQAGFCFKNSDEKIILIDACLSDAVEREFGFKRMSPSILEVGEIEIDLYLSTHSHLDHLDTDALPVAAANSKTLFIGAPDCGEVYRRYAIPENRFFLLAEGEEQDFGWVKLRAVYADHGELAPQAVGLLLDFGGIRIYHVGDSAYAPERIAASLHTAIDVLISPINGQFGNMNARETIELALRLKPKRVIACHFWMFLEHVAADGLGDPATFLRHAERLLSETGIEAVVMAPGEVSLLPVKVL